MRSSMCWRRVAPAAISSGARRRKWCVPAKISDYLISHPIIRKISFTGSAAVSKQLAAVAGAQPRE